MGTTDGLDADRQAQRQPEQTPGRVESLLLRWLGKDATVSAVDAWSERFRMVELQGEALRGIAWTAGQKIQIPIGGMRVSRTYTPITWDAARGTTRFLVWSHGSAPGSDWARTLAPGTACQVIGPRRSVDVASGSAPIVLFGDETAFGLASALQRAEPARDLHLLLEVTDAQECRPVLQRLGLHADLLAERVATDAHLPAVEARVTAHAATGAVFVLTGRASAIQHIRRTLKQLGVGASRQHARAYWAAGKSGLD